MPNNGHYTLCPYYRDEKNKSISCDDVCRTFRYPIQKKRWMEDYCDKAWQDCPHAKRLNEMYDRIERGADMTTEELKLKNEELDKELKKVKSMYGKSESNGRKKDAEIERLRKQKDELIQDVAFQKELVKRHKAENKRRNRENDELKKQVTDMMKFNSTTILSYEEKFVYLLDKFGDGKFDVLDFDEWQRGKEYTLNTTKVDPKTNRPIELTAVVKQKKGGKDVS